MSQIYFITSLQLSKLTTSHAFHRKRFTLAETLLSRAEFNTVFSNSETLAWNNSYQIQEGDVLLYHNHHFGTGAKAEVKTTNLIGDSNGNTNS